MMARQYEGGRSETVTVKVTAITKRKLKDLSLRLRKGMSELGAIAIEAFIDGDEPEMEDDKDAPEYKP